MFLRSVTHAFHRLMIDNKGAAIIEYALLAALIALVATTSLTKLGKKTKREFTTISAKL